MKLIKRLTDNYKKNPESNIGKLLSIVDYEIDNMKLAFNTIELYRSIDNATGITLDNIGKNVLQERGVMDDVLYRLLLKTKVRANLSGGQIETLNDVLNVLLGVNFLSIREVWNDPTYGNEPAALEIRYINFFDKIRAQYSNAEDDPWYLNGNYDLSGVRLLDGGLTFIYSDYEPKILEAMAQTKKMVNFVKAGGVKAYWVEPLLVENAINITHDTNLKTNKNLVNTINITQDVNISKLTASNIENNPAVLFEDTYFFNSDLTMSGVRPIIRHDVTITEVTA